MLRPLSCARGLPQGANARDPTWIRKRQGFRVQYAKAAVWPTIFFLGYAGRSRDVEMARKLLSDEGQNPMRSAIRSKSKLAAASRDH
ncbi:MAG: hypothetical protein DCC68_20665 [Planctomycetota bacterium]|nr:MAG: hypothetical protein DCC68_20665 [Planctomycetota bacterium]